MRKLFIIILSLFLFAVALNTYAQNNGHYFFKELLKFKFFWEGDLLNQPTLLLLILLILAALITGVMFIIQRAGLCLFRSMSLIAFGIVSLFLIYVGVNGISNGDGVFFRTFNGEGDLLSKYVEFFEVNLEVNKKNTY